MESYCWHPRHKNPPPILTPIPDLHQIFPHLKLYQIRHATISLAISHIFRRNSTKSDLATPLGQVFSRCIAGFFDDDFDQDYLQAWSQMQQLITSQPSGTNKVILGRNVSQGRIFISSTLPVFLHVLWQGSLRARG